MTELTKLVSEFHDLTAKIGDTYQNKDGERDRELEFQECVEDILQGAFDGLCNNPERPSPDRLKRLSETFAKMIVDSGKELLKGE